VLNPDHVICTVSKGGRFFRGADHHGRRGYVPSERTKQAGQPIGTIALDALYSPIRKVN